MTAIFGERAKRLQLVAWVPPLMKVPITAVMAAVQLMESVGVSDARPATPPTSTMPV